MKSKRHTIVPEVLRWYRNQRRDLPWRETRDPYRILVSEMMLQQTQVSRVERKFPEFLHRFPTLKALAKASKAEVIRAWSGLGYNRRALRLREVARIAAERFGGTLPRSVELLQALPGIGRYTAHALSCFTYGEPVAIVDTNVRRVLTRIFWTTTQSKSRQDEERIWRLAEILLPTKKSRDWNFALMDLGATVCRASDPQCQDCPVRKSCRSAFTVRRDRRSTSRQEPVYQGRPRRYYRGRVIEALRNINHDGSISARHLGPLVKPGFKLWELPWLHGILRQLEREGLIVTCRKRKPAGTYVCLAS